MKIYFASPGRLTLLWLLRKSMKIIISEWFSGGGKKFSRQKIQAYCTIVMVLLAKDWGFG
jgi:hypothetical protein